MAVLTLLLALAPAVGFDADSLSVDPRKKAAGQEAFLRSRGADDDYIDGVGAGGATGQRLPAVAPHTEFRAGRFDVRRHITIGMVESDLDTATEELPNLGGGDAVVEPQKFLEVSATGGATKISEVACGISAASRLIASIPRMLLERSTTQPLTQSTPRAGRMRYAG